MTMKDKYTEYSKSNEKKIVMYKDYYTDDNGVPNKLAFADFTESMGYDEELLLYCISVDLSIVNSSEGYASGNRIMRKIYVTLEELGVYVFRICGEKFNLLVPPNIKEVVDRYLNEDNGKYRIYCGVASRLYNLFTADENIEEAKEAMYADRAKKNKKKVVATIKQNKIVGSKGNTPEILQETRFKKYRETMWYAVAKITVNQEQIKELVFYIFPTDYKPPLASLPIIVVCDDMLEYRVFKGNNIEFTAECVKFDVNARFDTEGALAISIFSEPRICSIEFLEKHEGTCIPANFGKRVGTAEIFPIKKNISGVYDYVMLKDNAVTINQSGTIEIDGIKYGVYADKKEINLLKI